MRAASAGKLDLSRREIGAKDAQAVQDDLVIQS